MNRVHEAPFDAAHVKLGNLDEGTSHHTKIKLVIQYLLEDICTSACGVREETLEIIVKIASAVKLQTSFAGNLLAMKPAVVNSSLSQRLLPSSKFQYKRLGSVALEHAVHLKQTSLEVHPHCGSCHTSLWNSQSPLTSTS